MCRFRPAIIVLFCTVLFARSAEKAVDHAPLPVAVSSFGAAVADGYVYLYGGHTGKTHQYSTETASGQFLRLKLSDPKAWEKLPGGPSMQGLAVVAHHGKIYRIGGMQPRNKPGDKSDNHSLTSVSRFDPKEMKWEALPDLPEGRSSHDAVVIDNKLYVAGGWKMNGTGQKSAWHKTVLIMDLAKKPLKWESIPQPFERRALTAAAFQGKLYVICGLTADAEMERGVDIFDPATGKWTTGPEVPAPIGNGFTPAACVAGNHLCLSPADGRLFRLSEKGDRWDVIGKLAQARMVHRMVPASDRLMLAIGGASKNGNVAMIEALDPTAAAIVSETTVKPGTQAYCPIMTSVPVGSDSTIVEYKGQKVLICCNACVKKWNADPEAYLDKKILPQLAAMELPSRKLAQVYCPVYKDRVVSEKDPFVMYKGVKIFVFNESARKKFEANPEEYVDRKILPQLTAAPTR